MQSAATHNNNNDKHIVNLIWFPPTTFNGTVAFKLILLDIKDFKVSFRISDWSHFYFRATFVKEVSTYWVKTAALETVDIIIPAQDTTTTAPVSIFIIWISIDPYFYFKIFLNIRLRNQPRQQQQLRPRYFNWFMLRPTVYSLWLILVLISNWILFRKSWINCDKQFLK